MVPMESRTGVRYGIVKARVTEYSNHEDFRPGIDMALFCAGRQEGVHDSLERPF